MYRYCLLFKLSMIMRITRKAKMSDVVKIQYGSKGDDKTVHITNTDRLHIPGNAGNVILSVQYMVMSTLEDCYSLTNPSVPHTCMHMYTRKPTQTHKPSHTR